MNITSYSANKAEISETVKDLFVNVFGTPIQYAEYLSQNQVWPHIDQLIDSVWIFLETPYVDKVFRDSYYHYFSSKSGQYKKDCIRLSIFSEEISLHDFRDSSKLEDLESKYLGFIILRPTTPFVIGRSTISPKALKNHDFLCCTVNIPATVNAVKLTASGFPHSSQDTETITCAETTIWALMEYFGYRYAEYKPVLPSQIIEALRNVSSERQIPSRGLNIQQMAFAIKEFSFGPRIYSNLQFGNAFFPLLNTYIESGIPLILAIENRRHGGSIAHAMLCIGKAKIADSKIDGLIPLIETDPTISQIITDKQLQLFDLSDLDNEFIFIDDNHPVYQKASLNAPAQNYPDPSWHNCEITYFIAPLYPKIYLEAFEAKKYFKQFFFRIFHPIIPDEAEITFRFFLTSSRSYKNSIAHNEPMDDDMKTIILETSMPKFVWIGELTQKEILKQKLANGIVILDATEANTLNNKPLILAAFINKIITFDSTEGKLSALDLPVPNFGIFTNYSGGF